MRARLFEPGRHQPLTHQPWQPQLVERALAELVAETLRALDPDRFWPPHPRDDDYLGSRVQTTLYAGAGGVLWALFELRRRGIPIGDLDLVELTWRAYRQWQRRPDAGAVPSLLLGEGGLLLLLAELGEAQPIADRLASVVAANHDNRARELMWGAPGTMRIAWRMAELTGDSRWRELCRQSGRHLMAGLEQDDRGAWLWTQQLYGDRVRYLGACHGAAGCHQALLASRDALEPTEAALVVERAAAFAKLSAHRENGLANWPAVAGGGEGDFLVQWCHGAPGVVVSLHAVPVDADPPLEAILREAGELIWRAGPLTKGTSLCHGAAGNGYALLALHARTGDPLWLERARAFAMHAIGQLAASRRQFGQARFTLFTGHLGAAVFLADCLAGAGRMPVVG